MNEAGKGVLTGAAGGAATGSVFGPWGALIGGVVGAGAGLFGGIQAGKKRRRMEQYLSGQQSDNEAWYNQNALSNYTNRADVSALMRTMRENLYRQNRASANMSVVTGATQEAQAAQKEETNRTLSDAYARLAGMGQQWKDRVFDVYSRRKDAMNASQLGMWNQQATGYENLMNGGIGMMGDATQAFANWYDAYRKNKQPAQTQESLVES
jgi:gas vesicle protein